MRYTLLCVTPDGVPLWDYHLRRLGLGAGDPALAELVRALDGAGPGTWAVTVDGGSVRLERRGASALYDGMPVRWAPSPVADRRGTVPKPRPPCPYDAVRAKGVATLLTSPDRSEIWEACRAAVLGWDGSRLACVPRDRPRVWSAAEQAVREHLGPAETPLPAHSPAPLLLVNAVKGTCEVALPGRPPFPGAAREAVELLMEELTRRPT